MKLFIIHQRFSKNENEGYNNQWSWYFTDYDKARLFYVKSVRDWEKDGTLSNGFRLGYNQTAKLGGEYEIREYTNGVRKIAWVFTTAHTLDQEQ